MAESRKDFLAQLAVLRESYVQQLPEKLQQIQSTWTSLLEDQSNRETLRTLHRMAHSLTGSGATFGLDEVSAKARVLERKLKTLVESSDAPVAAAKKVVESAMDALQLAVARAGTAAGASPVEVVAQTTSARKTAPADERLVFIVEDELLAAQEIALQLGHYGFATRVFGRIADLRSALETTQPSAVVIDVNLPDGNSAEVFAAAAGAERTALPMIFVTSSTDFATRLLAVRAGGVAFFTKPLDVGAVADRLDAITRVSHMDDYKVLVVDDSESMAEYHATILTQAGMVTRVVNDPTQIMAPLTEMSPDIILMDVYMPECSGLELAAVLRQQEIYLGIPIVFLSSETDISKQLMALGLGADDFLTKPIDPDHLVAAVTARVQRARAMRALMVHDSLTGLLNHTAIKDALEREMSQVRRHKGSLVFALIDVDRFKSVNDTHGHQVGDRVLKSLARLLQQRLRKSDYIGRYGGEEFAVILPFSDAASAKGVLETLRKAFSEVVHAVGDINLSCTFSAGIAVYQEPQDLAELIKLADTAMYAAKAAGRNRILIAQ
jgi:diguanylate cyclase (GGDEF)-like protein